MGRMDKAREAVERKQEALTGKAGGDELAAAAVGELEAMDGRPETIPKHVWAIMRENGELATKQLNSLLRSPKFPRLSASDQAKLITLAQNRAYGTPQSGVAKQRKSRAGSGDIVQAELDSLVYRASLPEYRGRSEEVDDADVVYDEVSETDE